MQTFFEVSIGLAIEEKHMYAVINENLYWYQNYRGKIIVLARNGQPVDDSFHRSGEAFEKVADKNDPTIRDIYDVRYYVEYADSRIKDQNIWNIDYGFTTHRPYKIENGEACLYKFGAVSGEGWTTNGRDESYKIISLSQCTRFYAEYTYVKRSFNVCVEKVTEKVELSKDELINTIIKHQV